MTVLQLNRLLYGPHSVIYLEKTFRSFVCVEIETPDELIALTVRGRVLGMKCNFTKHFRPGTSVDPISAITQLGRSDVSNWTNKRGKYKNLHGKEQRELLCHRHCFARINL